jgi:hypothetical protein
VGFENPFYPQNYPQKIRMGFEALLQFYGQFSRCRFRGEVFGFYAFISYTVSG